MDTMLAEGIEWVGHIDWNVRDFHSYNTTRGATYNAYLIRDQENALVDTVKAPYADELLGKLRDRLPLAAIRYVICNHAENDHSGALPAVMAALPKATLVCGAKCAETLGRLYDTSGWTVQTVKTGDTLSLGRRTLHFIETPMVHWPDSIFTYVPEEKLLFSMDAFGQHYATSNRFDDLVPICAVMEEAKTYYANIVQPYGKQVAKVLEAAAGLEIRQIAPSHGVIWRRHIPAILQAYRHWSAGTPKPRVLVAYDTMWESTAAMADAIAAGASQPGLSVQLLHIRRSDLTSLATEILDAAAVAFGSSTLNQGLMPMAGAVLTYWKGLRPAPKPCLAFGSYGWGRGAPEAIDAWFREMKWDVVTEPLKSQYRPGSEILESCRQAGAALAERARAATERDPAARLCQDA